jgi:hypothetical protein
MECVMTDMERDYAGRIIDWAFRNFKGIEDVSHEEMVKQYWEAQGYETDISSTIGAMDIIC